MEQASQNRLDRVARETRVRHTTFGVFLVAVGLILALNQPRTGYSFRTICLCDRCRARVYLGAKNS